MAGRLKGAVTTFLLFGIFFKNFTMDRHKLAVNEKLELLEATKEASKPRIDSFQSLKKRCLYKVWQRVPTRKKLEMAIRLINIGLMANLILLSKDVSLNPGPAGILPRTKGLRLFHLNISSIKNKLDELRLFCDEHKPHVLSLNETWLDNSILDSELAIPGYNIIRQDRDRFVMDE